MVTRKENLPFNAGGKRLRNNGVVSYNETFIWRYARL